MKQVRFPEGCAMSLYIPLILLPNDGNPIDPTKLTDLEASVSLHGVVTQITPSFADSCIVLPLGEDLKAGQYVIAYSFKYDGRPFAGRWANVLEIVKDNAQSNWQGYLAEGSMTILDDQIFVAGPTMTDEELEQLKAEYRAKIAEAEDAKAAADAAKAEADAVAYNAAHTLTPEGIENAVRAAIPTDYAKTGEYDSKLSELSTQCAEIEGKVGTPLDGQPATLFAAIAQGGGGGGATPEQIADAVLAKVTIIPNMDGYVYVPAETSILGMLIRRANCVSIRDEKLIDIPSFQSQGFTSLKKLDFPNALTIVYGAFLNLPIQELYLKSYNADLVSAILQGVNDLILLDIGYAFNTNRNISIWNPTNAIRNDISTLVSDGEPFANNREKLLYNIREHIAANLQDRSAESIHYTIKFNGNVYNVMDAETKAAFTNKGWNVSA